MCLMQLSETHKNYNIDRYDTQLYLKCFRDEMTFAATRLEHCLTDVSRWMSANRLKLNSEKTELVWVWAHSVRKWWPIATAWNRHCCC